MANISNIAKMADPAARIQQFNAKGHSSAPNPGVQGFTPSPGNPLPTQGQLQAQVNANNEASPPPMSAQQAQNQAKVDMFNRDMQMRRDMFKPPVPAPHVDTTYYTGGYTPTQPNVSYSSMPQNVGYSSLPPNYSQGMAGYRNPGYTGGYISPIDMMKNYGLYNGF